MAPGAPAEPKAPGAPAEPRTMRESLFVATGSCEELIDNGDT